MLVICVVYVQKHIIEVKENNPPIVDYDHILERLDTVERIQKGEE